MADQTREAIDARYAVTEALKGLIYGPHYDYVTTQVQERLRAALEAVEDSEELDPEPGEYPGSFPDISSQVRVSDGKGGYVASVLQDGVYGAPTPDVMAVRMANAAAQALTCFRCGRKYRPDEREQLVPADEGKFKCDPSGPLYDACMRIYNA